MVRRGTRHGFAWAASATLLGIFPLDAEVVPADQQVTPVDVVDNDIVVTAQRSEQRLKDVPISIAVVSGAQLDRAGTRSLEDMASRLPNIKIAQIPGGDAVTLRGVGSGLNLGFEQSVATFVDDAYRGRARASRLSFFDVERVELLRGPQTTYFGNNAIAGAINITTRKPGHDWDYNATALYAPTDGEYSVEAGITAPITDTFSIRVAGRASGLGGYIHNDADGTKGPDTNDRIGRVAVRWQPSSTFQLDARIDHGRTRGKGIYDTELLFCPAAAAFGTPAGACGRALRAGGGQVDDRLNYHTYTGPSHLSYDFTEAEVKAAVDLGDHRLTATTTYFHHDYDQLSNVIPTPAGSVTAGVGFGLSTRSKEKLDQFTQELRFESSNERPISYMIGAYYLHGDLSTDQRSGFWFVSNFASYVHNTQEDNLFSLFATTNVRLTSRFKANFGLRWSLADKSATRAALGGSANYALTTAALVPSNSPLLAALGTSTQPFAQPQRSDHALTPSVNLQYAVTDSVNVYGSYTRGFKAGGFAMGATNAIFAPEKVDAFEAGLKSSFWHNRATLNVALYHSLYHNLQEATFVILPSGAPQGSIGNAASTVTKGVEFSGSLKPFKGLTLSFDGAYLSSKYDRYPLAPCTALGTFQNAACVQNMSGKDRAFSPHWSGNVGAQYEMAIGNAYRLSLESQVFLTTRYFEQSNADPLSLQKGYGKIDARVGFGPASGRWEAAVVAKNLNDVETASFRSALPSSPGSYQALPDRPRSVALQFTIRR